MSRFVGEVAPIAVADRSGFDESIHHGAGVALDGERVLATVGDPDLVVYPRSCLKPLQVDAMIALGLDVPDDQLAVACASHDGAEIHLRTVRRLLADHGLGEHDLDNTPARPFGAGARSAARLAGVEPSSLQQNCSGKHAAMLATCAVNGWPTAGYRDADHPLQRGITAHLRALGCAVEHVGVDGCGAPAHAFALRDLARAFARVAQPGSRVARAMGAHPVLVAGEDRDVTAWLRALPGAVAKEGAAGMMAAGLPDGRAVAFKIADGSDVARRAVTPEALRAVGLDVDTLAADAVLASRVPVLGHGREVGVLRALDWSSCSS